MSWFHVCKHLKNASKSCAFADCPIFYGRDNEFDAFRVRCCYFGPEQQNKTKRSYQKSESSVLENTSHEAEVKQ